MEDIEQHFLGAIPENVHSDSAVRKRAIPEISLSPQRHVLSWKGRAAVSSPPKMKNKKRTKRRRVFPTSDYNSLEKMSVHFVCVSVALNLAKFSKLVATFPVLTKVLENQKLDLDLEWYCAQGASNKDRFQVFVMNTGCAVFWSCPKWLRDAIVVAMNKVSDERNFLEEEWDDLDFRYGDGSQMKTCIKNDVVFLKCLFPNQMLVSDGDKDSDYQNAEPEYKLKKSPKRAEKHEINEKMAISFALAQSIRIGCLEGRVQAKIKENNDLPRMLATTGIINLNKREINQRIGSLFQIQAQVNLIGHALNEIPNWFWEQSDLYQDTYLTIIDYLGVSSRIEVLNQQLHTIEDLMQFISDQQNEMHASSLEWLIVYLIVAEVLLQLGGIIINYI